MNANLIVIDNFYGDPDAVRKFALNQSFDRFGNYPGARTKNFLQPEVKSKLQDILKPFSGNIVKWNDEDPGFSGSFQLTTSINKSWVHSDTSGNWGGVLYLTPDAPLSGGTGFFKSKLDGSFVQDKNKLPEGIWCDMTKWEKVSEVGNVYNRLILFRSNQWHSSLDYFGQDMNTDRLTQVFFIRTES